MAEQGQSHESESFSTLSCMNSQSTTTSSMSDGSNESQRQRDEIMKQQLLLLKPQSTDNPLGEIDTAPLFTKPVRDHSEQSAISTSWAPISQYGLLAGDVRYIQSESLEDAPIYYNVAAPSSIFICGSQGSGKSHTLSCILENCLIPLEKLGRLPHPLTGIVFHYDDYSSDSYVAPCEAAYLCSHPAVHVRVLCPPTNIRAIKKSYSKLGNVTVEALCLDQTDLNTKRMLELMAFDRAQPLYAQVIQRILREMRLKQQVNPGTFNYREFTDKLDNEQLSPDQKRGLRQRLDLLESFMVQNQVMPTWKQSENAQRGNNWTPKAGELIIVDLSCPCITTSMACALFNICLSIFLEQDLTQRPDSPRGRIVALDEAHRYMGDTSDCQVLTNSLLSAIRVQRHLGARIVISTQEPTISQKLLDLCSVTIVHRFSSPDWLNVLTKHLAGISKVTTLTRKTNDRDICDEETDHGGLHGIDISTENPIHDLFAQIVELSAGEALVFAPSAVMSLRKQKDPIQGFKVTPRKLAHHVLRVKVRARITEDGGRSVMAS